MIYFFIYSFWFIFSQIIVRMTRLAKFYRKHIYINIYISPPIFFCFFLFFYYLHYVQTKARGGQTRFFLKKPIGCSESNITTILFEDSPNKWSPYVATCLVIILTQVPKPQILVSVSNPIYTLNFFIRTTFFKYLSCFLKMLGTKLFL